MTAVSRDELLATLVELRRLSPDVRFGQLLANLGLLMEDQTDRSFWDVEDAQLLDVMERHRDDLTRRLRSHG